LLQLYHHLLSSFAFVLALLVEQVEPLEEARVALQSSLVVINIYHSVPVAVHLLEYVLKGFGVDARLAACDYAKMRDELCDDFSEVSEEKLSRVLDV
jgi:hypothetical protein